MGVVSLGLVADEEEGGSLGEDSPLGSLTVVVDLADGSCVCLINVRGWGSPAEAADLVLDFGRRFL